MDEKDFSPQRGSMETFYKHREDIITHKILLDQLKIAMAAKSIRGFI